MTQPDDASRLYHILDSARKAVDFTRSNNLEDLRNNELLGLALVRLLEVIGAASSGISEGFQAKYPGIPWRKMTSTRNRLIHGYIDVDLEIILAIVTQDLPPLIVQMEHVLKEERM
jgi:uncharacterized protein with HEPN domain